MFMEDVMEVRTEGKDAPQVAGVAQCLENINQQLQAAGEAAVKKLRAKPQQFAEIEKSLHETFQRLADQLTANVLADGTQDAPKLETAKKK